MKKYFLVFSLLLSACAHETKQPESVSHFNPHEEQAGITAPLPKIALTKDYLYDFLLSEIAKQRSQGAIAASSSLELAKKTRDPRIARRATQLAVESGQMDKAIEAIKIWQELEPNSVISMRMLASVLVSGGKLEEAKKEIDKVLKLEEPQAGVVFLQIYKMLANYPDGKAALKLMSDLKDSYPKVAEAHWGLAHLAQSTGDDKLALNEVRRARELRPEWDLAVSLEAQLLQKTDPAQGMEVLRVFLKKNPKSGEIRLQYARALLEQKQYSLARDEFMQLAKDEPGNPEFVFAIALISMQMNDLQNAEEQFKQSLSMGKKDQDAVNYYLGQLSESKSKDDEATDYYKKVKSGDYLFSAQVRVAILMGKRGQIEEARQQLHQIHTVNLQQRVQLILVESQLLREADRVKDAYQWLKDHLEKLPDNPDLLYGTAMMADRLGKSDEFEQLIRKLIKVKPDYPHAYNALGYSLLERNIRIPEAVALVEKALQLAPDDAAIMDSVGWGYYRSGKLDESIEMLRRALSATPDPEIAAHLGEVLWVRGDKKEAKKVWRDSLKANPGNEVLKSVMNKFMP